MTAINENRTIQISDLPAPDEATVSKISSDAICRILAANARRGYAIGSVLCVIGFIGFFVTIFFYHNTTLAIGSIILSIFFRVFAMLSYQKMRLAYRVSIEPRLAYWAHPQRSLIRSRLIKYRPDLLTLHSRTGQSLEVAMSHEQMTIVLGWLRRQNPDIRVGDYDTTQN